MRLCMDAVCLLSSFQLAVLLKLFSSTVMLGVCIHVYTYTSHQCLSVSVKEKQQNLEEQVLASKFSKTFRISLFFLSSFIPQLHKSGSQQTKILWRSEKTVLVIFPFVVAVKALCLNDTSFHSAQCKRDSSFLLQFCFNEIY